MKTAGKYPPKMTSRMFLSRNGNVYVADGSNNRILKYTPGQVDAEIIAGGQAWQSSDLSHLNNPTSVIVDDKGTLYIAEKGNKRIVRWAAGDSAGIKLADTSFLLSAIRFDRYGNLYGLENVALTRYQINSSGCAVDEIGTSLVGNGAMIG